MKIKEHLKSMDVLKHIVMIIICFIALSPIFWIISQSFKSYFDTIAVPPKIFSKIVLDNFIDIFTHGTFLSSLLDSIIVALGSSFLGLILGTPCSYAISRLNFKGSKSIAFFMLITVMVSPIIIIIPLNRLFQLLGLIDTHFGLILAHTFINLGLVVWLLRGFFDDIPISIEEAAKIDGCSTTSVFFKIALPLVAPGLVATLIFCFILSWNELLIALTLSGLGVRTTPVFIISEYVGYLATEWGKMSAAGILVVAPMIVFLLIIQKHFVRGLTAGVVKE